MEAASAVVAGGGMEGKADTDGIEGETNACASVGELWFVEPAPVTLPSCSADGFFSASVSAAVFTSASGAVAFAAVPSTPVSTLVTASSEAAPTTPPSNSITLAASCCGICMCISHLTSTRCSKQSTSFSVISSLIGSQCPIAHTQNCGTPDNLGSSNGSPPSSCPGAPPSWPFFSSATASASAFVAAAPLSSILSSHSPANTERRLSNSGSTIFPYLASSAARSAAYRERIST
mmetsp:Transcript_47887/g.93551  ORF Transcript_47887/g.93551 Transcript_47887/m.93551 type:complete len:234 (+) Transcript_47887:941-1642(+)